MTIKLEVGTPILSITVADVTQKGVRRYTVGESLVKSIVLGELPGPVGFFLVAVIHYDGEKVGVDVELPPTMIPLHTAISFDVLPQ